MDAGNMLKPALARGELRCIGATTLDEYRKHIEKDPALERRFQPVLVGAALRGRHHRDPARAEGALRGPPRRRIQDAALVAAATLSDRYITDRFLPDKAIDLIDEAASKLKMEIDSHADRDRRSRAADPRSSRSSEQALQKEDAKAAKERLKGLEKDARGAQGA